MKVVIVGAGFGGLRLARNLNNRAGFSVVLVDRFNYHQFQPLFYQVATAGLDASNISFPLRKVFHGSDNVRIRLAELTEIRPEANEIVTDREVVSYEALVLAVGADTNFFGNEQMARHAFPMKSTAEALQIRHSLLQNFEECLATRDPEELQRRMNIVIVGGGPTGVELAGALAEMKKYVLPKDYPELDFSMMNIYLLEGGSKTLASMSERSSAQSCKYLKRVGVKVLTDTLVKDYDGVRVDLGDGKTIPSAMVVWAAGVKGNIPAGIDPAAVVRGHRIRVDRHCLVAGYNNIYAIGDLAYMETPKYPKGHPQVASVAIQQAELLADYLKRLERKSTRFFEFEYLDKGTMATVGRNLAVVDIPRPRLHFGGFFAWLIWMGLHLMLILGVKNRFFVFFNWVYNYVTYDQNLRLIFREFYKPRNESPET
ncbi:MAG TPA: NAD(P)/FAD-dependent oxidoreductase [Chitinophagaceae bacterium]|nr:NAD(P)/FAD-dependent oxidoreductase [Chitinophagaceae bacterium]